MDTVKEIYKAGLTTIKDYSTAGKLQLLAILAFVCTLTLNTRLNSLLLIIVMGLQLFSFKFSELKRHRIPVLIFTSGFLLSLISLSYSGNRPEGWHVLERQLSLLLMPLIFFSSFTSDRVKFHLILKVFFISVVLISGYLIICSYEKFRESHVQLSDWFIRDNLYHAFSSPIHMHATYLSLYVALAIFTGFYWLLLNDAWWIKPFVFLFILVLVVTLTLLSSRVVISSFILVLFAVYPFYIGKLKHMFPLLLAGIIIILTFFFMKRESSFVTKRFTERMDAEVKLTPFLKADSTYNPIYGGEARADRWYCAVELIRENPWKGYGTGSEKDVLMQKYRKYNLQNAELHNYDAHNQYLAYAIKSGVAGLLLFLISVGYALYISIKSRSFIYLSFVLLFTVTCITENVLESNKGIFFFAFFNTLFCCHCLYKRPEKTADETDA